MVNGVSDTIMNVEFFGGCELYGGLEDAWVGCWQKRVKNYEVSRSENQKSREDAIFSVLSRC